MIYKIRKFEHGYDDPFEVSADNIEDLKNKLAETYKSGEVLICDHGFRYVNNRQHFIATGHIHLLEMLEEDCPILGEPAHFNPPFFEIISSREWPNVFI